VDLKNKVGKVIMCSIRWKGMGGGEEFMEIKKWGWGKW
jgi:hypothetical protein